MKLPRLDPVARVLAAKRYRWALPLLTPGLAVANPTGGEVTYGDATISNPDANTVQIDQSTNSAAINWQSFSIDEGEYVVFVQPSSSSVTLNRVVGASPSEIFGHLTANGRIFLINPNGILFAPGAQVDVAGLLATTMDISDEDFINGNYVFSGSGEGSVVNQGNLYAAENGFVVLAGDYVANTGVITATLGHVVLASGSAMTLTLDGDGLVAYTVDAAALSERAGVENLGEILADGGKVVMTAKVARELRGTVVNNEGLVQARSIVAGENGEIILSAEGGDVVNAGVLDASGVNGNDGGTIRLFSDRGTFLTPTSELHAAGDGAEAKGGYVGVSGNDVTIRGVLSIGRGGKFRLDPPDVVIADGAGADTSTTIFEQTVEGMLRDGTDVDIIASRSITLQNLSDNELDGRGALGAAGAGNGGSLLLGIGSSDGSFFPGLGESGVTHSILFQDVDDAIRVDGDLWLSGAGLAAYGGIRTGDLITTAGDVIIDAGGGISVRRIDAGGNVFVDIGGKLILREETIAGGNISLHTNGIGSGAAIWYHSLSAGGHIQVRNDNQGMFNSASPSDLSATPGTITAGSYVMIETGASNASPIATGGRLFTGNITAGTDPNAEFGGIILDAAGHVRVGNLQAVDSISVTSRAGDITLSDITIQHSGDFTGLFLNASDYAGAGYGNIYANDAADDIVIHNTFGAAHFAAYAAGDLLVNNLVMSGGGGSASPVLDGPGEIVIGNPTACSGAMAGVCAQAGGDLTIEAANITTREFTFTFGDNVDRSAGVVLDLEAGNDLTLGNDGLFTATGRGWFDANFWASNDVNLHNVSLVALRAEHVNISTFSSGFSSFGGSHAHMNIGIGAGHNLNFVAGKTTNIRVQGDTLGDFSSGISLWASNDVNVAGTLNVTAERGTYFDRGSASSDGIMSAHDDFSDHGHADVWMGAGNTINVSASGRINVRGEGFAGLTLWASSEGASATGINVDGAVSVIATPGLFTESWSWSSPGFASSGTNFSRTGNADVLFQSNRDILIGSTGAVTVEDYGGDSGRGYGEEICLECLTANLDIQSGGDVEIHGDIVVRGNAGLSYGGEFWTSGSIDHHTSFERNAGAARLDVAAGQNVLVGADATIQVFAAGDATASFLAGSFGSGDLTFDGDLGVEAARGRSFFVQTAHHQPTGDLLSRYKTSSSAGEAEVWLAAAPFGGSGSVQVGPDASLLVRGNGYAALGLEAANDVTVDTSLSVDARRGRYLTESSNGSIASRDFEDFGSAEIYFSAGSNLMVAGALNAAAAGFAQINASVNGNAAFGGPVTVQTTAGHFESSSTDPSYGYAFKAKTGGAEFNVSASGSIAATHPILVKAVGDASVSLSGNTVAVQDITLYALPGTFEGTLPLIVPSATEIIVSPGTFTASADLQLSGSSTSARNVDVRGQQVFLQFSNTTLSGNLVALAESTVYGWGSVAVPNGGVSVAAGDLIDFGSLAVHAGTGRAVFGADPLLPTLLALSIPPGQRPASLTPNAAFSAKKVILGDLSLDGDNLFLRMDELVFAGSISAPSNLVVRYMPFTPNATIHLDTSLPGTRNENELYLSEADHFSKFPGTTHVFGGFNSSSNIIIGTGAITQNAGANYLFLTNGSVFDLNLVQTGGTVFHIQPVVLLGLQPFGSEYTPKDRTREEEGGDVFTSGGTDDSGEIEEESGAGVKQECT